MNMNNLIETSGKLKLVLADAADNSRTSSEGYDEIASVFNRFVVDNDYDLTPQGFIKAAEDLRDHSFPEWPFAGMPLEPSGIPRDEDSARSVARGVGLYLAVAIEELSGQSKCGAERIDEFLENSGLLTIDVRE